MTTRYIKYIQNENQNLIMWTSIYNVVNLLIIRNSVAVALQTYLKICDHKIGIQFEALKWNIRFVEHSIVIQLKL